MGARERKKRKKERGGAGGALAKPLSLSLSLSARDWSSESTDLILILYSPLCSHAAAEEALQLLRREKEEELWGKREELK